MANSIHSEQKQEEKQDVVEDLLSRRFAVFLYNDDFTPMDFVVLVLRKIFNMPEDAALETMMKVHCDGFGMAGVFSREIATTKVDQSTRAAVHAGHPFRCEVRPI